MSALFQEIQIGEVSLKHRVVLAPLTRFRADGNHVPLPIAKEYYAQRASSPGTLLISEGTFISAQAGGNEHVPGVWSEAQIHGWRQVSDAVHAKGCYIVCQLWALGRAAQPEILARTGHKVVSASNIAMSPESSKPEPLSESGIRSFIDNYATAAMNASTAGFDSVEIHGTNGYLCDQFLQDVSNIRTDSWGGSIENRAWFGVRVADAVAKAIGPHRVCYRMSPWSPFQSMKMKDPKPQSTYLAKSLRQIGLAYIHIVQSRISGWSDIHRTDESTIAETEEQVDFLLHAWKETKTSQAERTAAIIAGGSTAEAARATAERYRNVPVLIGFGRNYLASPDLLKCWAPKGSYKRSVRRFCLASKH